MFHCPFRDKLKGVTVEDVKPVRYDYIHQMTYRGFHSYDSFLHTSGHKIRIGARSSPLSRFIAPSILYRWT